MARPVSVAPRTPETSPDDPSDPSDQAPHPVKPPGVGSRTTSRPLAATAASHAACATRPPANTASEVPGADLPSGTRSMRRPASRPRRSTTRSPPRWRARRSGLASRAPRALRPSFAVRSAVGTPRSWPCTSAPEGRADAFSCRTPTTFHAPIPTGWRRRAPPPADEVRRDDAINARRTARRRRACPRTPV